MRDIDLIPASYHRQRQLQRQLIRAGSVLGAVVLVCVGGRFGLGYMTEQVDAEINRLQAQQTITTQQRDQLAAFQSQRKDYEQQLRLLKGLRSGTAAENLFRIIDRVLIPNEVWFLVWEFRRAGVSQGEARPGQPGYFVMASDEASASEPWHVETHMKISGQASDHVTLSEFVQRLIKQPEIRDVRVRNTSVRRYTLRTVVDFDLAIVIDSEVLET